MNQIRIVAIAAVFNRLEMTLRCLKSLYASLPARVDLEVVILDDGSSDGTWRALKDEYPRSIVIRGTGSMYWAKGMALAESNAAIMDCDYLLWINNDVEVYAGALVSLLETSRGTAIAVGAIEEYQGARCLSYGGIDRVGPSPTQLRKREPLQHENRVVHTMNGNLVLIPREVSKVVGPIDDQFQHAYADIDYGMRATARGVQVLMTQTFVGACSSNSPDRTWRDSHLSRVKRLAHLFSIKGMPLRSQSRFVRRHGGRLWVAYLAASYAKPLVQILRGR